MQVEVVNVRTSADGHTFGIGLNVRNERVTFLLDRARTAWVKRAVRAGEFVRITLAPYSIIRVRRAR